MHIFIFSEVMEYEKMHHKTHDVASVRKRKMQDVARKYGCKNGNNMIVYKRLKNMCTK